MLFHSLDVCSDDNKTSLTRRTSSIIEKHDRWVVWRYHWRQRYRSGYPIHQKKCGNIGWETKSYFWNMMFHNTEKTEHRHGNAPQIVFVARTTTPKSLKNAGFVFLFHKLVFIVSRVDWCAWIRPNVRISLLVKESATGSTLRNHEQSMEHKDATITFSRKCN